MIQVRFEIERFLSEASGLLPRWGSGGALPVARFGRGGGVEPVARFGRGGGVVGCFSVRLFVSRSRMIK